MKQMALNIRHVTLVLSLIALGACTAAWGRSFTMVGSARNYVKYQYYLATVDEGGMTREAINYCATNLENAVLVDREALPGGAMDEFVNTYQCVPTAMALPEQN